MQRTVSVSFVSFLLIFIFLPTASAEYPTSAPQIYEFFKLEPTGGTEGGASRSSSATVLTWTNGGGDNLASNPANWSGGVIPQNGDEIVFDGTSSDDCTWDLTVTLNTVTISSGYAGSVILSGERLTIAESHIWSGGGTDNLASNAANWSENSVPQDGDRIVFNDTSIKDCVWDISISPDEFSTNSTYSGNVSLNTDISISGNLTVAGGTFDLNNHNLIVYGYLLINTGGTLNAASSIIEVKGDWLNYGAFIYGYSTVILSGTDQTIYGNTTFYNLVKTAASADTLYFEAGSTQTIINSLNLQGASSNLLYLRSTVDGQQWYLNAKGTRHISYTSINDMNNTNPVDIDAADSEDAGNNSNISFVGSECASLWHRLTPVIVAYDDWRLPC